MDLMEALAAFRERNRVQYDVFISYSTRNTDAALEVLGALQAADLECFYAPNDIDRFLYDERANQFVLPLRDALVRSCQCVALLSAPYMDSAWCELELIGSFNLSRPGDPRSLHLYELDDVRDRLIGQLHGYIRAGGLAGLVRAVVEAKERSALRIGDDLGTAPPTCFPDLALRQFYEPPGQARRAPWGHDARTPRATPGAPPYSSYQDLVREYMVQINRLGGPPVLFEERDPLVLDLHMANLPDKYEFISREARRDAEHLLRLGHSPTPWRPSFAEIWQDASAAQKSQGDSAGIQRRLGLVQFWEGNWQQALKHFERAVAMEEPLDDANVAYLAATHYQARDYQRAADLLRPLADRANFLVSKVLAMSLARLGCGEEAARARDALLAISPGFSLLRERVDTWFVENEALDHWIGGLRLAGLE